jgi:hypothetical protein
VEPDVRLAVQAVRAVALVRFGLKRISGEPRPAGRQLSLPLGGGTGGPGPTDPWDEIHQGIQWVKDHAYWVVGAVVAFYVVTTLIWALVLWLRSRGIFMEIDNLAFGRGKVKEPWSEFRQLGNNFFKFNFLAGLALSVLILGTLVAAGFIAWPDIVNRQFDTHLLWAIIVLVVVIPLAVVNFALLEVLLIDFIAPTMYLRGVLIGEAWRIWYREIFKGHFWLLTLFYLMKLVLGIAVGIVSLMATCLMCCLPVLPYLGTVMLLPAYVFMRCYTLYFLEQFGEPWRLFVYEEGSVICLTCGYDLRGNPNAIMCPECGAATPPGAQNDLPPPEPTPSV